ncbi:MAG: isoprenylcysteine carboxylmethyltransferase family protein [Candidatus Aminicenantales bacterium]
MPIYLTLAVISLSQPQSGKVLADILWLKITGLILFLPSALFVVVPIVTLEHKGKSDTSASPLLAPSDATIMLDTGIFKMIRHPLYFGTALWSVALIFIVQSILSLFLGGGAIFCFWMASKKEDEFNIRKFGDRYQEYMKKVPMWNIFKGLRK